MLKVISIDTGAAVIYPTASGIVPCEGGNFKSLKLYSDAHELIAEIFGNCIIEIPQGKTFTGKIIPSPKSKGK